MKTDLTKNLKDEPWSEIHVELRDEDLYKQLMLDNVGRSKQSTCIICSGGEFKPHYTEKVHCECGRLK